MAEKKRKKRTKRQKWVRFVKFELFLLVLLIAAVGVFFGSGYASKITELRKDALFLVNNSTEDTFKASQTSIAYDVNGTTLSVLKGEKDSYYVSGEDIPTYAKQAIVSIEDKKYYDHHGVDYQAIIRAGWSYIRTRHISQGGSTITQQLAKNVFLTAEKTWTRKVKEIFIATELEKKYSKAKILEFYLNNVYFGNGFYGIQAASRGYFNREVGELSLSEIAFLCAIPNRPTYYDPKKHFGNTIKRRNKILDNMYNDKVISETTHSQAVKETITLEEPPEEEQHNYPETFTFYCATRALMENDGFEFKTVFNSDSEREEYQDEYEATYSEYNSRLYTGGYRIYTSLNLDTQEMLQKAVDEGLERFDETGEDGTYALQGAGVCIDNTTGMVRAIVGGRTQETKGYTLNRGFQSFRQPGSTIKPVIVYTPALEGKYSANSMINDHKFEDGPSNSGGGYHGNVTLRYAVEHSLNTVAWQIFEDLTPEVGISYLEKMQFSRLSEKDKTPAASLGGFTYGVSPLEMAKAYATIENDGAYRDPSCILKITDSVNRTIYQPDKDEEVVYEEDAARQMTNIMQGVLTNGTGKGLGLGEMETAGKTGTTNDNKDGWFCGFTPYYTTSIWVGYDKPRTLHGLFGASYPGQIWHNFMEELHKDLEPKEFTRPTNYVAPTTEVLGGEENQEAEEEKTDVIEEELKEKKKDKKEKKSNDMDSNSNTDTNTETQNDMGGETETDTGGDAPVDDGGGGAPAPETGGGEETGDAPEAEE